MAIIDPILDLIKGTETFQNAQDALLNIGPGVYSRYPSQTPKYHTGNDIESIASQARFFLSLPDHATYKKYVQQIPDRARPLVEVLSPQSASGGGGGYGYFDFLLTGVQASSREKVQVSEVLTDSYIAYFFGRKAPVWNLSGMLMNTVEDEWYDAFHVLYEDVIRGSQLAKYRIPLRLSYDNRIITGALMNMQSNMTAESESGVTFSTQLLVKKVYLRRAEVIEEPTNLREAGYGSYNLQSPPDEQVFTQVFADLSDAQATRDVEQRLAIGLRQGFDPVEVEERVNENQEVTGFEGGFTAEEDREKTEEASGGQSTLPSGGQTKAPVSSSGNEVNYSQAPPEDEAGVQASFADEEIPQ